MDKDKVKIIELSIAFIAVIFFGFLIWKLDLLKNSTSSASLAANPPSFDFGQISMAQGNVATNFSIQNTGEESIKISGVQTSCMCTTATIDGHTFGMHSDPSTSIEISAGESKEMSVVFDPNAHGPEATGPIIREIMIQTNSEKTPEIKIQVKGNVTK